MNVPSYSRHSKRPPYRGRFGTPLSGGAVHVPEAGFHVAPSLRFGLHGMTN